MRSISSGRDTEAGSVGHKKAGHFQKMKAICFVGGRTLEGGKMAGDEGVAVGQTLNDLICLLLFTH